MRFYTLLLAVGSFCAGAAVLENQGWRRQERSGAVAYFKGDEAMVMVVPPKPYAGDVRPALVVAMQSYLGGKLAGGGDVQDAPDGAVMAEYQVREPNGTQTWRAAMAWARDGRMEALLYAANDAASYQRYRADAMAFFASYRDPRRADAPAPAAGGSAITGEWYTGSISTIQRRDTVTGMLAPPSGNNMTYKFLPGGAYQQYGLMQFTYATCINSYFMNITGRYTLRGDELVITPLDGTFDSRTCGGQPVRKPVNKVESTYRIRISGNELTMTDNKGASSTYRRK